MVLGRTVAGRFFGGKVLPQLKSELQRGLESAPLNSELYKQKIKLIKKAERGERALRNLDKKALKNWGNTLHGTAAGVATVGST